MKTFIITLLVLLLGAGVYFGYVHFNPAGDANNPGMSVTVDKGKVKALEEKAKEAVHKETAPANP